VVTGGYSLLFYDELMEASFQHSKNKQLLKELDMKNIYLQCCLTKQEILVEYSIVDNLLHRLSHLKHWLICMPF
jgi:hypothetical protein